MNEFKEIADLIRHSGNICAFTGAGISVESGIPPFRGEGGLWSKYDPAILDLDTYKTNSEKSWPVIKKLFFDFFGKAKVNDAHTGLAKLEKAGYLKSIITQNIDNLHFDAGNKEVYEYHGNSRQMLCLSCSEVEQVKNIFLNDKAPRCKNCGGLLKPDFIFFGEGIPMDAYENSLNAARTCDLMILIGTKGEVIPASSLPYIAKESGAKIIEINIEETVYTASISDYFIKQKASIAMNNLIKELNL